MEKDEFQTKNKSTSDDNELSSDGDTLSKSHNDKNFKSFTGRVLQSSKSLRMILDEGK